MIKYLCPSCGVRAEMQYIGIQVDENEEPMCSLWNCQECRSTVDGVFYPNEAVLLDGSPLVQEGVE